MAFPIMNDYDAMIVKQAETYNSTMWRMHLANSAFNGSDSYDAILLDVYVSHFLGCSIDKAIYLKFVASISEEDFAAIENGTHPIVA